MQTAGAQNAAIKWRSARHDRQHKTLGLAFQRAGLGHFVNERHKERGDKRDQITTVFDFLFDSVILCRFTRGFGIVLILACVFFPCFDAVTVCSASGFSFSASVSS